MSHPDQAYGSRTYAQFGEDLILLDVFYHKVGIKKGTYFDVGAHHPYNISNTALLYEFGWRGVCIEANPNLIPELQRGRPEDTVLNVGINTEQGQLDFYMIDDYSGRNSFDKATAEKFVHDYPQFTINEIKSIPVVTLDSLFEEIYVPDLLSLDIEGLDFKVLESMKARPKVICVEIESKEDMFDCLLKEKNYVKIYSTAGNGIYLDENFSN